MKSNQLVNLMDNKILFVHHGPNGPHAVHSAFASSITSEWVFAGDNYLEILLKLFNALKNNNYDAVLCEGGWTLPYGLVKKFLRPSLKIVLLDNDTFFYIWLNSKIKRYALKFLLSWVDSIIAVSDLNKRMGSMAFNGPIYKVTPYGVNNHFDINCDLQSKNVLFIGSDGPYKGYDLLVEALRIVNNKDDDFHLYLLGDCSKKVKEDYQWLHKEGFKRNLRRYFKKCSIYVHPAEFEAFGVVALEAMSAGMIPILTNSTGSSEILKRNNLDFLILEDNNPKNIASKILEVYNKPLSWKKEISKECKMISSQFSEDLQVKKFKEAFKMALEGCDDD